MKERHALWNKIHPLKIFTSKKNASIINIHHLPSMVPALWKRGGNHTSKIFHEFQQTLNFPLLCFSSTITPFLSISVKEPKSSTITRRQPSPDAKAHKTTKSDCFLTFKLSMTHDRNSATTLSSLKVKLIFLILFPTKIII